jgi:hypothetical protein
MTTAQIVILIISSIVFIAAICIPHAKLIKHQENAGPSFMLGFLCFLFYTTLVISLVIDNNRLKSETPCPKLEKIENAYKIVP